MAPKGIDVGLYLPLQPPLSTVRQIVWAARLLGLDSLLVWDHFQDFVPQSLWTDDFSWLAREVPTPHAFYDFQVGLGYLAARAGRLRLGVGVTEANRRHPVLIAQAMMTLSHITKRRPILGLGAGERENTEPYGIEFRNQVSRLEEALQIIRLCWDSRGPFDFEGKHFQLRGAVMDLSPAKGKTPEIWIAANGPRMLRLVGTYADGWYPAATMLPEDYAAKLDVIRNSAREAGRDPDQITPALQAVVALAPSEEEARAMLHTRALRFNALLAYAEEWQKLGFKHPLGPNFRGYVDIIPEQLSRDQLEDAIQQVPDEVIEATRFCGTPEQVANRLRALGDVGLRHVVLIPVSAQISRRAALYSLRAARQIKRALRG